MKRAMKFIAATPALLAIVATGACGTGGSVPGSTPFDRFGPSIAHRLPVARPDRRPSWISPRLAKTKAPALFVSDAETESVYIYDLATLQMQGTITGLVQPQGLCSDDKGNVWITDAAARLVYEVTHTGHLRNELKVPSGSPAACAWDRTTGDLAVMILFDGSAAGEVLVYKHGSGEASSYTNPDQYYYGFGGYDPKGNLYFDGSDAGGNFMLSLLAKGASSAKTVAVAGGTIYYPGMVQWDAAAKRLIVGDQSCGNQYASCLYLLKPAKTSANITDTVNLQKSGGGQVCDLVQGVEYKGTIAGSDYDFCTSSPSTTYVWPFPGGGAPSQENSSVDRAPVGAAVSI
jgi:hypothetical protein